MQFFLALSMLYTLQTLSTKNELLVVYLLVRQVRSAYLLQDEIISSQNCQENEKTLDSILEGTIFPVLLAICTKGSHGNKEQIQV